MFKKILKLFLKWKVVEITWEVVSKVIKVLIFIAFLPVSLPYSIIKGKKRKN